MSLFRPHEVFLYLFNKYGDRTSEFLFYHNPLDKIIKKPKNINKNTLIIPICINYSYMSHMCTLLKTLDNKIYFINPGSDYNILPQLIKNFIIEVGWNCDNIYYINDGKKYECIKSCIHHILHLVQ